MKIHTIGINYLHEKGVIINRPHGSGDYLLIIFKTDGYVEINGGMIDVVPNDAIVFRKNTKQLYGRRDELYIDHCVHMEIDNNSELSNSGLVFDKVFHISNINAIEHLLSMMSLEFYSYTEHGNANALLLCQILINKLGENCTGSLYINVLPAQRTCLDIIQLIHSEIHSNPAASVTIRELAEKANISVPHFQRLYKNLFGVSCYDDIINSRIKLACHYLKTTDNPIKDVALCCGYESYENFMRQFKKHTGKSPGQYKKYC